MTTVPMSYRPGTLIALPTREEWRAMLTRPAVAITAILSATFLAALFITAVTVLAYTGKGADALTGAGMIGLITALVTVYLKVKSVEKHVVNNSGSDAQ